MRASPHLARLGTEPRRNVALVDHILSCTDVFPPVPEPDQALIGTDAESVDLAIARALALAAHGVISRVGLKNDGRSGV